MKFTSIWTALLVCLAFSIADADTITMLGGQVLTGDILAEKDDVIIIDIGFTALAIPRDRMNGFKYDIPDAPTADANQILLTPAAPLGSSGRLYSTTRLPKLKIEAAVETVAQAVVKVSTPSGSGSGFFFHPDGYLITNYHVIERETLIEVTVFEKTGDGFEKKRYRKVSIEAINPFIDLAILRVQNLGETKVHFAYLGDIEDLQVGEKVFAIGSPLGLERTVTDGVVSTKNRAFEGLVFIQTNADINPGNSGGPLFNLAGEVVGVTNMGYIFYGGLGFAIPVDYVKHFIDNRDAFAYDKDNPNSGFRYIQPDGRKNYAMPPIKKETDTAKAEIRN